MFPNTVVLFHVEDEKYTKHIIKNCFYYDYEQKNLDKIGMKSSNSLTVVIDTNSDIKITEGEDIIVKDECSLDIDNSNEETISNSLKELKSKYEVYTVTKKGRNLYGGIPSIVLSCK